MPTEALLTVSGGGFFSFSGDIVNGAVTFSGGGSGGFMDLTGVNKSFAGPLTIDGKYVQVGERSPTLKSCCTASRFRSRRDSSQEPAP